MVSSRDAQKSKHPESVNTKKVGVSNLDHPKAVSLSGFFFSLPALPMHYLNDCLPACLSVYLSVSLSQTDIPICVKYDLFRIKRLLTHDCLYF